MGGDSKIFVQKLIPNVIRKLEEEMFGKIRREISR